MSAAIARLTEALEALAEPTSCAGTLRLATPVAITLPDGDSRAVDDPGFVDWLVANSELAPFGDGRETRLDTTVRRTLRVRSRGEAICTFDPATILDEVAAALSPRRQLAARLTDVLVYPAEGRFARHKDTPSDPELVGTLIVGLPIAHTGGVFVVHDAQGPRVLDWSVAPDPQTVRWVALYGDVDHEIKRVESGARVTLVYALVHTTERIDPTWDERVAMVRAAVTALVDDKTILPAGGELMIACTRQVITPRDAGTSQPQPITTLRGVDRDVADVLVACGLPVAVRTCVAATRAETSPAPRFPSELVDVARLARPLPAKAVASLGEVLTFADPESVESSEYDGVPSTLAPYILDEPPANSWVIRASARATLVHEAMFSADGYFGNEHYEAYIYTLAALEVTLGTLEARGLAEPPPPAVRAARVRHPKFGDGDVIARVANGKDVILEIQFDSGDRKKLLERFVQPL